MNVLCALAAIAWGVIAITRVVISHGEGAEIAMLLSLTFAIHGRQFK